MKTLDELASALEVPIEELKESITHTFKAADEEMTVTLAELEKGYQKDADYRRQTGKLAEDRRTAEQDYNARMQQFDAHNNELAAYFNAVEQTFQARFNDPKLAELRQRDPAERGRPQPGGRARGRSGAAPGGSRGLGPESSR